MMSTKQKLEKNMDLPKQIERMDRAYRIKHSMMKVNDNTFVFPSQREEGEKKAHIVTIEEIELELFRIIPNRLLVEASELCDFSNCFRRRTEFNVRVSEFLSRLAEFRINEENLIKIYHCTCEDHLYRPEYVCKHIIAAMLNEPDI